MSDKASHRCELGKFLRNRRARIDPSVVGLPTGRRRTPGLRREEVAVLAGLSPTWYTYLEQGRDIKPSPELLNSLARVLRLNEDERSYLHVLAYGRRPPPEASPALQPDDTVLLCELVETFDSRYPVYAVNSNADVLAWNDAVVEWYTDFAELPDPHRNSVWWVLMEPEARERFVNWDEVARDMVGQLRAMAAADEVDNERLAHLIEELHDLSPEFRIWWPDYQLSNEEPRPRTLRHPIRGVQAMRMVVVLPVGVGDARLIVHLPVTER